MSDHPHDHDHHHDHDHPGAGTPARGTAPDPATPHPGDAPEDASSRALSDALQSSFRIVRFLMVVLVVIFFSSGIFTVNPNEVAIKLRFGKPVGTGAEQLLRPGLQWAFPAPIDEIIRVPVGQSHTIVSTIGWPPITPQQEAAGERPTAYGVLRPDADGYTLTGDGNIIHARATLKYRIRPDSAALYHFAYAGLTNILQHVVDNALIHASARSTAEGALYRDKIAFNDTVRARIEKGIADLGIGIVIETEDIQTMAPEDVREAFDAVLTAQQVAQQRISESEAYARGATNNALGQANSILNDGLTTSNQIVRTLAAESRRFEDQLPHYRANPTLFRQRLLTETLGRVHTNAQMKIFLPSRADGKSRELRLQLNREPEAPGANKPAQ